jgi:His/Glu/Gln/Arg/opine family amino acid ABC transporter permease subunit
MEDFLFVFVPKFLPRLLGGAVVTLQLTALSLALSIVIGLLVALGRLSGNRLLHALLGAYIEVWRDVPLIVQLLFIYFALPQLGISLPAFAAGVVGLALNLGAYLSEVFRAAILSVDKGQRDAAISIGMSRMQMYMRVVFPQAFLVAIPTIGGYSISLLKDCSLVSFIAVNELLREGTIVIAETFRSMEVYILVGFIYFVMSFILSRIVRWLEMKLTPAYLREARGFGYAA